MGIYRERREKTRKGPAYAAPIYRALYRRNDDIAARQETALVRQHNAGPPGGSPHICCGHPFLVVPHLLPTFFTSTAKGRHRRCGNGYCMLKLALATLRSAAVKFLPFWGTALVRRANARRPVGAAVSALRVAERGWAPLAGPPRVAPPPGGPPPPGGGGVPPPGAGQPPCARDGGAPALRYAERGHRRPYGAARHCRLVTASQCLVINISGVQSFIYLPSAAVIVRLRLSSGAALVQAAPLPPPPATRSFSQHLSP
jgi:hypothetical protein